MRPCMADHNFSGNEAPFAWKNPNNIPSNKDEVTHLELLKKYNIPYIFDIHCHFFPEVVLKAIWKWFDKVNWKITYRYKEEKRLDSLNRNNFKKFTTLNYAHKPKMAENLNKWVYENYKNWKGAIPFGTFYPEENVLSYTQKAVEEYNFKGFKLHCEVSKLNLNIPELKSTFTYLEKKQIPIVIHTGTAPLPGEFTGIKYFEPFIKTYPELLVIVAHMGAHEVFPYANLINKFPNLYLDTTMAFVDFLATGEDMDSLIPLLETHKTKIMYGSDFPNIPYNLSHSVESLLNANISMDAKQNIFYRNAERLIGDGE
ncbi:MAG: amidohydrolase [Leptospiraceae bacterium]|nr:amidohydrolase [Leptospiraceae bacterium]